jgi:glycosyl transferase, family 25
MDIPVYVINLEHCKDRRDHTLHQLDELGIPLTFVKAFDGSAISDQEIRSSQEYGIYKSGFHSYYLRKEEIGCTMSHLSIYRKMIEENIPMACILEDDNDYSIESKEILQNESITRPDWDILYLGHHSGGSIKAAQCIKKIRVEPLNYFIGEAVEVPYGTYAYMIRLNAAKILLEKAYPIKYPFDTYLGNSPAIGIKTFLLVPPCAVNSSQFKSTIYYGQMVESTSPYWNRSDRMIKKIYLWFPYLRALRVLIYNNLHTGRRYLRKTGLVRNRYAKY